MKIVRRLSAVLLGAVLLVAGYLKTLDPVGAGLVVSEYFNFFGITFLGPLSKGVACALALLEEIVGIALVAGIWRRAIALISAVLLGFFTVLTAVLLILNPNLDCGCFGSLVTLTHLQSFLKNVVLCGLWVLSFVPFRTMEEPNRIKYLGFALSSLVAIGVLGHFLVNVPAVDGTPYAGGARLYGSLYYNFDAPVLSFYNAEGEYCDSLAWNGDKVVVSVYDPDRLSDADWNRISDFVDLLSDSPYTPLVLVGSAPGYFTQDPGSQVFYSDPGTLVTLNRSNGGATLLENGEIAGKCAFYELPQETSDIADSIDLNVGGFVMAQGALLAILGFLLLL